MVDYTADTAARQQDDLDRLAARSLSARKARSAPPKDRSIWPWMLAATLVALLLGMIARPWFERQVRSQMPETLQAEQSPMRDPRVDAVIARLAALESRPPASPDEPAAAARAIGPDDIAPITSRVAALEAQAAAFQSSDASISARLEQLASDLERTSGTALAGDRQVRDLFLVAVARRMVDSGRPLGPVQGALSNRFADRDAAAIESLERWSAVPQTRASLGSRLDTMAMARVASQSVAASASFWERLKARMSGLVTVADGPADQLSKADAVLAAQDALDQGDLALAAARMQRAPASAERDEWISDARTLVAAEAALDRLESALLDAASAAAEAAVPTVLPPAQAAPPAATLTIP